MRCFRAISPAFHMAMAGHGPKNGPNAFSRHRPLWASDMQLPSAASLETEALTFLLAEAGLDADLTILKEVSQRVIPTHCPWHTLNGIPLMVFAYLAISHGNLEELVAEDSAYP